MKYPAVFFLVFLCACRTGGALRTDIVGDYTDDAIRYHYGVRFHGYTERPNTSFLIPPFFISFNGSHESEECYYYDNRYISARVPTDSYSGDISARIQLDGGVLVEGRVIALQNVSNNVWIDFYFPLSCDDMQGATFYLTDADKELVAITTYYRTRGR